MQHCVASHTQSAVAGHCYLFHVNRKDDQQATIEVGRDGRVMQARGPRNQRNKATAWGTRLLNKWGGNFPDIAPPLQALPGNQY